MTSAREATPAPTSVHASGSAERPAKGRATGSRRLQWPFLVVQSIARCVCAGGCPGCRERDGGVKLSPGLYVSHPHDPLEREADRIAAEVMAAESGTHRHVPTGGLALQRYGRGPLERSPYPDTAALVDQVLRSPGRRLDTQTRLLMESHFGRDLSDVRVHTDALAAASAKATNSLAFTVNSDLVFDLGRYSPGTSEGRRLLAHELVHVVQQTRSPPDPCRRRELQAAGKENEVADPSAPESHAPDIGLQEAEWTDRQTVRVARSPADTRTERAQPTPPTWDVASKVVGAIVDIINQYVYVEGGLARRKTHPAHHKDVPAQYQGLLKEWFLITHGTVRYKDFGVSYRGSHLAIHIDMAMAETKPLLRVLMTQGDERVGPWLDREFYRVVEQFRARALKEEVWEVITSEAAKRGAVTGFQAMMEFEGVKIATVRAVDAVRLLTTLVTRFTNSAAIDAATKLDWTFKEALRDVSGPPAIEAIKSAASLPLALMHLKGVLDGVNAIINITDDKRREEMFKARPDLFGRVRQYADIPQVLGQLVSGSTAIASAGTYAYAVAVGNTRLAGIVLSKAAPALDKINVILNVLGVIRGTLVLLDEGATVEQKEWAALEVGVSGAGVTGFVARFLRIAGVTGPLTLSIVVNFFVFREVLHAGSEMVTNMIRLGLNICYTDMQRTAQDVFVTSVRLATALDLALKEKDPARKGEFLKQADSLKWNLTDFTLKPYLERATRLYGSRNEDPGNYAPLRRRFLALKGSKLGTAEEALDTAGRFIGVVVGCITEAEQILRETIRDVSER